MPVPDDRESYIAAQMLKAAWLAHVQRVAEHAWAQNTGGRTPVVLWPFSGVEIDAAARVLARELRPEPDLPVDRDADEA